MLYYDSVKRSLFYSPTVWRCDQWSERIPVYLDSFSIDATESGWVCRFAGGVHDEERTVGSLAEAVDIVMAILRSHESPAAKQDPGADTFSHWMSITQTLRKLERPLLPYLRESLAAHFLGCAPPSLFGRELPDGN